MSNLSLQFKPERTRKGYPTYESASLYGVQTEVPADFRYREVGNESYYIDRVYVGKGQAFDRVEEDGSRKRFSTLSEAFRG